MSSHIARQASSIIEPAAKKSWGNAVLIKLEGGTIYDPVQGLNGMVGDVFIRDGVTVTDPGPGTRFDAVYDLSGQIVMAGGVDIHSHIAGGNVNTARMLLPDQFAHAVGEGEMFPVDRCSFTAQEIGALYARMGYTTVVGPAVLPCSARTAYMEMADIRVIDKAALAILGNDGFLLRLIQSGASQAMINDYAAWMLSATRALGLKCINAGGIEAHKANASSFDLDDVVPFYGVTSRQILQALNRAVGDLGIGHPLHVHCNNLGLAGRIETVLATMEAAEGAPMHLAHVQFYGYGTEGPHKFSSASAQLLEGLKRHPNITIDVGQVLFGQTVTISGDVIAQFSHRSSANPKKWVVWHGESGGGGGVVPYQYRPKSFINALQWSVGLELFLLADDPWRVFFTTDHPNGAPFTRYPELIRLLMDRDYRTACLDTLHPEARNMSLLPSITREFSLYEIAIMTRAAPAKLLGLPDRGTLKAGSKADITVYTPSADAASMFTACKFLFKDGRVVIDNGKLVLGAQGSTLMSTPEYDKLIVPQIKSYHDSYSTVSLENYTLSDDEIIHPVVVAETA